MTFTAITQLIDTQLTEFNQRFRSYIQSDVLLLKAMEDHVFASPGKQIRPVLVLLSAQMNGSSNDSTYRGASLIEMIHQASLLHDDVVDMALLRRGQASVNAQWTNRSAVLMGDYLFATALRIALEHNEIQQLCTVNDAIAKMSEGELLQLQSIGSEALSEPLYIRIITQKTAVLLAACTACGALSAGADADAIERMRQIGLNIGIVFQIQDDLLDLDPQANTGKPSASDIREEKYTLPIIHLLRKLKPEQKRIWLERFKTFEPDQASLSSLHRELERQGSIDYCHQIMQSYADKARTLLSTFPNSPHRKAFEDLISFIIHRNH